MTVYTLVEYAPGRFLILDDGGAFCGAGPWVKGQAPVVEGAHPSIAWFPFGSAVSTVRRWLDAEAEGFCLCA